MNPTHSSGSMPCAEHRQHAGQRPTAQPQQQQRRGDGRDRERDADQKIA